jgi:nucleoid DNA-binding protein
MDSTELTTLLAQKYQLSDEEMAQRLDDAISVITAELLENNSVILHNLGTLEIEKRDERISVRPSSGKRVLIPPKLIVKFKMADTLKDKLKG